MFGEVERFSATCASRRLETLSCSSLTLPPDEPDSRSTTTDSSGRGGGYHAGRRTFILHQRAGLLLHGHLERPAIRQAFSPPFRRTTPPPSLLRRVSSRREPTRPPTACELYPAPARLPSPSSSSQCPGAPAGGSPPAPTWRRCAHAPPRRGCPAGDVTPPPPPPLRAPPTCRWWRGCRSGLSTRPAPRRSPCGAPRPPTVRWRWWRPTPRAGSGVGGGGN